MSCTGHARRWCALARLARGRRAMRVYTPHGGSPAIGGGTFVAFFYLAAERARMRRTDLFLFESVRSRRPCKIGQPRAPGVSAITADGARVRSRGALDPQARDLAFVGELRALRASTS
jgi:hypothetical protein